MSDMRPINLREAARRIVRTLPGGDDLAPRMTDDWIRCGFTLQFETEEARAIYRAAADRLEKGIQSGAIRAFDESGAPVFARHHTLAIRLGRLIPMPGYDGRVIVGVQVAPEDLAPAEAAPPDAPEPGKRGKGGRRPTFNPDLIKDLVQDLVETKGHPLEDPMPKWNSIDDVIQGVNEALVKRGEPEMSQSRGYALISPLLNSEDS
jgi:hypothetical protein